MLRNIVIVLHIILGLLIIIADDQFLLFLTLGALVNGGGLLLATIEAFTIYYFNKNKRHDKLHLFTTWLYLNLSLHWILIYIISTGAHRMFIS